MDSVYHVLKVIHVIGFVMMSIPLFNLIVVNERVLMGSSFSYATDRYMENIIRHGAVRCYIFQLTVLISGMFLLVFGPLGLQSILTNWVIIIKTAVLFILMGLLSFVHFHLQPRIEELMTTISPDSVIPEGFSARLKPYRVRRKRLATLCLFLVLTTIILGLQVYARFNPIITTALIASVALFSLRVNKTLILFGWI